MTLESLPHTIARWIRVEPGTECWLWSASLDANGYGHPNYRGRRVYAHRLVYELLVGPITPGLELDHAVCSVRHCVNPEHMEQVTHAENLRRRKFKQHCKKGHELFGENCRVDKRGWRQCRTCDRERKAR